MIPQASKRTAAGLEIAAALLVGLTAVAAYSGPLRIEAFGTTVSVRTLWRPLAGALFLLVIRVWIARGPTLLATALSVVARVGLGGLTTAGVAGWFVFLSAVCGGADSYGYVSAAQRLLAHDLVQQEPLARVLSFAHAIDAVCPLGYVASGRTAESCVPAYPLGLPAVMAVASVVAGPIGPFLVAPAMGVLLLFLAYITASFWYSDRLTALLSTSLLAFNPLVFTYALQPMSDVPAAAALLGAVAALSRPVPLPFLAGLCASLALFIRPALGPAILALTLIPFAAQRSTDWKSSVRYLAPVTVAIVLQGWMQWYLYGHPLSSGYGRISGLFSWQTVQTNLGIFGWWGWLTHGPIWLGALMVGLAVSGRRARLSMTLVALTVGTTYLFYRPYDHWETLRFLIPIITIGTIVAAAGLTAVVRRLARPSVADLMAAAIAVFMVASSVSWLSERHVFTMPADEARHKLAGELVTRATPPHAVILALQHSGSLRYYAGRQTMNWNRIPAGEFDATVAALEGRGLEVYVMIDSAAERAMFDAKHGRALETWLPGGQRRNVQLFARP